MEQHSLSAGTLNLQKTLADRLIAALQQEEYALYAQTIAPVAPGEEGRVFQEIFVRFKEEDANLLPPGSFFLILAECNLLPYLDRWVVNRLARWVRGAVHVKPDWPMPRSNVNLSAQTLADPGFGEYVLQYTSDAYLSNGALGLEISWYDAIEHQDSLRRLMGQLRPHGCGFTLADFDGSEPSFEVLKALAPQFVKLSSDTLDPAMLPEINHRCHLAECRTIVEHVESARVLAHLRQVGVDFVQGLEVSPVQALEP
jgi:EAL domain-containing protein (putative c-di-GMP-specific phosphodiesterase class I)